MTNGEAKAVLEMAIKSIMHKNEPSDIVLKAAMSKAISTLDEAERREKAVDAILGRH